MMVGEVTTLILIVFIEFIVDREARIIAHLHLACGKKRELIGARK
jgi:hypothetical protein